MQGSKKKKTQQNHTKIQKLKSKALKFIEETEWFYEMPNKGDMKGNFTPNDNN